MTALYRTVNRAATGKWLGVLAVAFLIAAVLNVGPPFGIAQLNEITGDAGVLDEMSYSAEEGYAVLEAQGEVGRAFYRRLLLTTELAFPLIYRAFNAVLIAYLFSRWTAPTSRLRYLSLLPLVGMAADYCENALVLMMLGAYPERLNGVATLASTATAIKWGSNYVDYALMIVGMIGLIVHAILKRKGQER
jgi:hypothetical protein